MNVLQQEAEHQGSLGSLPRPPAGTERLLCTRESSGFSPREQSSSSSFPVTGPGLGLAGDFKQFLITLGKGFSLRSSMEGCSVKSGSSSKIRNIWYSYKDWWFCLNSCLLLSISEVGSWFWFEIRMADNSKIRNIQAVLVLKEKWI